MVKHSSLTKILVALPFLAALALIFYPTLTSAGWVGLAAWNAVPVVLAYVVFVSASRSSAVATRASAFVFAGIVLAITVWGHLSWYLSPPTDSGASTAIIGFFFWPFYAIIVALVVSFIIWLLTLLVQRHRSSNHSMQPVSR